MNHAPQRSSVNLMRPFLCALILAVSPLFIIAQKAFVPTFVGSVFVVDLQTNQYIDTIVGAVNPTGVNFSPDGTKVYITSYGTSELLVIDVATHDILQSIPVGAGPNGVIAHPDGTRAYTANGDGNSVSVVDLQLNTVIATIPVGPFPNGLSIQPDGSSLYVSSFFDTSMFVVSTVSNAVTDTISIGLPTADFAIMPDGLTLYVADFTNAVHVVNTATNTVTGTIPVGSNPGELVLSPDAGAMYVNLVGDTVIMVINTSTNLVTDTIDLAGFAAGLSITPDGQHLVALDQADPDFNFVGWIKIINTTTLEITDQISCPEIPFAVGKFITPADITTSLASVTREMPGISIFPNPFTDRTTLVLDEALNNANIQVLDALGRTVRKMNNISGTRSTLEREGLPAGLYTLRITQSGGPVRSVKVTIE